MPAPSGLIVTVFLATFFLKCNAGRDVLIVADNTTVNLTCVDGIYYPTWFANGTTARTNGQSGYRSSFSINDGNVTATLTVNGNRICGTLNVYCKVYVTDTQQLVSMHNTTLIIRGRLPSPENVHINESVNSSTIQWKPPYSSMNNDAIHVDPHITQYTVYITDIYTGNIIVKKNVTGMRSSSSIQDDDVCLMYQVSAWNAGGEGELSEPVQKIPSRAPYSIAAKTISVAVTAGSDALSIYIDDVDTVCISRMPEFFIITLMTPAGRILNETFRHQPGHSVANFTTRLTQNVDVCNFHVRISAGNSAGISAPSEAVVVGCFGGSSESTASTVTAFSTIGTTESKNVTKRPQGDSNTLLIATIIGVIAAVGGVLIVAVGIMCCIKYRSKNSKVEHSEQSNNTYSESPSLGGPALQLSGHSPSPSGPAPLHKPPVPEVVYVTTEPTTRRPVAQTSDSAASSRRGSSDQLLQSSPLLQSPHLLYAQLSVKKTQVEPPANNNSAQYTQIKHQDKM